MNKTIGLFLVATLVLTISGLDLSQTEIDVVEKLLAQLQATSKTELSQLNEDYESSTLAKKSYIRALINSVQQQKGECNDRDQDVKNRERDIQLTNDYIDFLNHRLQVNTKRIQTLSDNRCSQNVNYIDGLKNSKISLRLVIFLRTALENSSEKDFSLVQKTKMGNFVLQFLSIYKHAKRPELVQLTKELEETFSFKFEEHTEAIPQVSQEMLDVELIQTQGVDRISGTKQELIDILTQIENDLRAQIANGQNHEIRVGISLGSYFASLEKENQQLIKTSIDEERNLVNLGNSLTTALQNSAQCKARLEQLGQSVAIGNQDLDSAAKLYESQSKRLKEEVGLFNDVYRIYASQVATSDDRFKGRVQDYVDNKSFDKTQQYSAQNNFGNIQGSVADAVKEQASRETLFA